MIRKHWLGVATALSIFVSSTATAAVSVKEAERLKADLTPIGAERAGNGSDIQPWRGGLTLPPLSYQKPGQHHPDPFPQDKPLFTITAKNMNKYAKYLSEGEKALFKTYPDTFKMPIFKTRRTASAPEWVYENTYKNAIRAELTKDGNGINYAFGGIPFPLAKTGIEVIWNHIVRYRGGSVARVVGQATPQKNGDFSVVKFKDEFTFRNKLKDVKAGEDENVLFYFKQDVLSPARLAGNVLLVHETIDQVKEPRKAWVYNAGQRRVRRAPQVAYDGPGTASDGLRTSDNFDMYNGSPDRYDWKLVGKQELYVPYNSYDLNSGDLKYKDIVKAGHINQDHTRYELHRVWKVEATLKSGKRHIYAKRTFYIDEDTWQATEVDHYDGRGQLWRVAEAHNIMFYDTLVPWYAVETLYDLNSGRYLVLGLDNEETGSYDFGFYRRKKDYTPSALRRAGRR